MIADVMGPITDCGPGGEQGSNGCKHRHVIPARRHRLGIDGNLPKVIFRGGKIAFTFAPRSSHASGIIPRWSGGGRVFFPTQKILDPSTISAAAVAVVMIAPLKLAGSVLYDDIRVFPILLRGGLSGDHL